MAQSNKSQPNKKLRMLVTAGTVVVALVLLWALVLRHESRPWTRDGQIRADIILLASQVAGRVVKVNVKDNQHVNEGDVLLEIDPASYVIAVTQAQVELDQARQQVAALEASVDAAKAGVEVSNAGIASAKGQIVSAAASVTAAKHNVDVSAAGVTSAQAGIAQSEANLMEAKRESQRADRLAKAGAGSLQTSQKKQATVLSKKAALDNSRAGLVKATASKAASDSGLTEAEASLLIAETGLAKAQASRASSIASLRQAEANLGARGEENVNVRLAKVTLANAELNLSRTKLLAPTDGWITNLFFEPGNYASPGSALLTFVAQKSLRVSGYFKETQLRHIKVGDRAVITPMADSSRTLEGVVDSIGWAINPPSIAQTEGAQAFVPQVQPTFEWIRLAQRVPVRIEFKELPEGLHLISGMTVSVAIYPK